MGCSSGKAALLGAVPCLAPLMGHSMRGSHRWTCWGGSVSQRPSIKWHMQMLVRVAVSLPGSVLSFGTSRVGHQEWATGGPYVSVAGWHAPIGAVISICGWLFSGDGLRLL